MRAFSASSAPAAGKAPVPTRGSIAALKGATLGSATGLEHALGTLGRLLTVWHTRAETRRQLAGLDARLLRDIGLHEDEVHQEVSKPFWMA